MTYRCLFSDQEQKEWEFVTPRKPLCPVFSHQEGEISVAATGNPYVFGYWQHKVPVKAGKYYCLKVVFQTEDIDDINLSVLNLINWRIEGKNPSQCPHDHISYFYREGGKIVGEDCFQAATGVNAAEIQLGVRYIAKGMVRWHTVELRESMPPQPRPVNVAVVKWSPNSCGTREKNIESIEKFAAQAAELKADLLLLTEFTSMYSEAATCEEIAETVPTGFYCQLLAKTARRYRMNICAGLVERSDDILFNTAVIFDRNGEYVGKYRKTHLYWPEAIFYGECPGDDYPVFELDFGRVGIIICYDGWYAETTRLLALKGAELVLYPNAGYEAKYAPARAIDNHVYLAISSWNIESQILDTLGNVLAMTQDGIICSTIDLSRRPVPHPNAGGTMNCGAAGRRGVRNAISEKLYEEILKEMKSWENRPEKYTWL